MEFISQIKNSKKNYYFTQLLNKNDINVYYTCISFTDLHNNIINENNIIINKNNIIEYYNTILENNGNNKWMWVLNCKNLSVQHLMYTSTIGIQLTQIIMNYSSTLQEIYIINPTWHIHSIIAIISPFLSTEVRNMIKIDNNIYLDH